MVFGTDTEHTTLTVVSSVFSENEKHEIHTQEGRPLKPSRFFCRGKSYHKPFSEQTQFSAKKCVLRSLSHEKPYFYRGILERARKIEDKTEKNDTSRFEKSKTKQRRTTQVDSSEQHYCRVFFLSKLRLREGSELKNDISENEV